MEIIGAIAFICIVGVIVAGMVDRHRQNIRDQLAHDVLDNKYDYLKEKEEILSFKERLISIKEKIKFLTPNIKLTTNTDTDYPVYVRKFCPTCKQGKLTKRKGAYGFFLGCSNYPKCRFTKNMN
ncbi:hypothetical protein COU49_02470 [Candidatus Nomurabacteria bacterium CG10_big_fil_rev_8_21_14_0_10_35_16]|uniref:DNA topoisomerase type IA zn finger domain-containing protein n=1 Tax=Candidatus Nomurabacteria bacterium CG10_big_fil_rev_8_21_14_0_10_35_16 TaxID=1974731 RepID=A0A2H0TAY9_9BACT|nr:MAG: hypothetical protein COU49_02470 [Candidatus Nomurabacteria bacterium CG10_big_fil_rev_8_21_14_0_10_35_16]